MQQKSFKNILSFITVIVFLFLAVGSKVRSIHCGAFYETTLRNEDVEGGDYYILLENGTKVYYDKMSYTSGLLLKHQFKVDGKIYKTVEVKGYASSGIYYTKFGSDFIRRVVHGKINVYVRQYQVAKTNSISHTTNLVTDCEYYGQRGENGKLIPIDNIADVTRFVKDCPAAYGMVTKNSAKWKKTIRQNYDFLNNIFETYNTECK